MDKFKVGDLVRVKLGSPSYERYKNDVGRIIHVRSHSILPYTAKFHGVTEVFAGDELEKV